MTGDDPFAALGLTARPDLTDDEVRAAWRRIAAATHPDLPDGGDAARFAAAAAAYATLRTRFGRTEAYADQHDPPAATRSPEVSAPATARQPASPVWRVRAGRPVMLLVRLVLAVAVCWGCVAVAGWQPATLAIAVGALTWLIRTSRYDLAPISAARN